jgi:hypothetical protein
MRFARGRRKSEIGIEWRAVSDFSDGSAGLVARLSDGLLTRDGSQFLAETLPPAQGELWPLQKVAAEGGVAGPGQTEGRSKAVARVLGLAYSSSKAS